ncbi:glucose-1-phosphate cytidylyltransferase [Deinococcus cellulosilyticus]|uniref:Glucose-1-phosphate cytidylyltransferase n=1 Tax=Deinococcus cellulosilyticus (strain DSM 18568 / NBRC 106333 / KACC 11606 / 5516J-15) TaxID=1223518 RepID=A0A511MXH3_DEIC1|nr:glucose-1-phosphate cytidylyltransferase [Deinococcus cellulosilyticus]GEM45260.1 glucose-1-phosphate cytidylyltransferase [Deinococcus cellulosilyticus NBRC 106333 = KACC 11606]
MKAVILAGGLGTRLAEETSIRPKPMVEIGGKPILWHIMNIYAAHGIKEFIIALGYKGESIKEYFLHYYAINNDISIDLKTGQTTIHDGKQPDWKVHLVDTGLHTQTGGRLKRLKDWLGEDETFLATYGDGVGNINITELLKFHADHGKLATLTAVRPPSRFGGLKLENGQITEFIEKPSLGEGWINGGFFVLNRKVLDFVQNDDIIWEREPLETLSRSGELMAFQHDGFWQPMDTLREKQVLEKLWESGNAPWKVWS